MAILEDFIRAGDRVEVHRPVPRALVAPKDWRLASEYLAGGALDLVGLWAEPALVHMALREKDTGAVAVVTCDAAGGQFPSVGQVHAPAIRLERAIRDLFGLEPVGLTDPRPWLDHGRWGLAHPLGHRTEPDATPYRFLPAEGESLHRIPVGPVHAGIIEPGHFRFTANGETVVRLEERLGYVHKGIESLMHGVPLDRAGALAGRTSGDSTVAYQWAFAGAVEAALEVTPPPRALWLRALMAELERIANHFGDIGAICNDASFGLMHAHCGVLRERVLRASDVAFGHRLMRDRIGVGGVTVDLAPTGRAAIEALLREARSRFPTLVELYDSTTSLQDRTAGAGRVSPELADQFGAGGYVGRAAGRSFDVRKSLAYAPYDALSFDLPVRTEGDVNARVWIRIREVEQSLRLIEQILAALPAGALRAEMPSPRAGEGMALVEAFR